MKRVLTILLLVYVVIPTSTLGFQSSEETTLILIRHVERAEDGTRNPPISEEGKQRAVNLYSVLSKDYQVDAIYSTNYKRTLMTATPTADSLQLEIKTYGFDNVEEWLSTLISEYAGKTVLIVGHSNTTPMLINTILGEEKLEQLHEDQYGDLFVITTSEMGSGTLSTAEF